MKHYQALIFDWDGTLADSTAQIVIAMQHACKQEKLPTLSKETIQSIIGLSLEQGIAHLYPQISEDTKQALIHHYREHYFQAGNTTVLFEGVQEQLAQLRQHYILGIATGKSRRGLNQALADTHIAPYFSATRTADECMSKPNPEMILSLCNQWDLPPEQILMIGDTTHDLLAGANAGADAVGLSTGAHSKQTLQNAPQKGVFSSFSEFYQWLNQAT